MEKKRKNVSKGADPDDIAFWCAVAKKKPKGMSDEEHAKVKKYAESLKKKK